MPTITIIGDNPYEWATGTEYTDPGASAVDDSGNDITNYVVVSGDVVNSNVIGSYTIRYNVSHNGNSAPEVTRIVNVVENSTGASGDPYITTISGITYKMDDFTGFARMLQGQLDGKLFTLNAQTGLLSKDEILDLMNWRKNNIGQRKFKDGSTFANFPAYFSKLYLSWGDKSFIINVNTLEIESSNFDVKMSSTYELTKEYDWSKKLSSASIVRIKIGKIILNVKSFDNKDVRNGFILENAELIENRSGALEYPIYTESMKLPSISSHSVIEIKQDELASEKRLAHEEFLENNKKVSKAFKVY